MQLPDVNVLVYAHREDSERHIEARRWLEAAVNGAEAFGISELVLSGFLRVVTHPRIFAIPSPMEDALAFVEQLRTAPTAVSISPGPRHWQIFRDLCRATGSKGNLVADAYLAAMAIESGCEWVTYDGDFQRFPNLRCSRPPR